jgi:hypothetical protein
MMGAMDLRLPPSSPGLCLLARIDYGHAVAAPAGWSQEDIRWGGDAPLAMALGAGTWILGAENLLGWARTRGGGAVWDRLEAQAARGRLGLQCRFPRHARELTRLLEARRIRVEMRETPADGAVPPLYTRLGGRPDLRRLHLEHEWLTGMAAARGGIALLRIASRLAEGPLPSGELARTLGLTSGAVRSYLAWMEDAALVRRAAGAFALRHPLLAALFSPMAFPEPELAATLPAPPRPAASPAGAQEPPGRSRPWDPVELD